MDLFFSTLLWLVEETTNKLKEKYYMGKTQEKYEKVFFV